MALDGANGNEGVTLWLGTRRDSHAVITHSVILRGPGIVKQPDFLSIEPGLLNDVADLAIRLNVSLVGQIHSHGPGYGTDLSYTDRTYGIKVPYYLSVVAPDYAMNDDVPIVDCGVHVYEQNLGFRRFLQPEIESRIEIIRDSRIPVLTVGDR
jgi:hypothetical protein